MKTLILLLALSPLAVAQKALKAPLACPECHPCETAQDHELGRPFSVNCQTESNEVIQKRLNKHVKHVRHGRNHRRNK